MITLTAEQFSSLVNGKFKTFKCTSCDGKGWYWVYEDGTQRDPKRGESVDDFYRHPCDFDEGDCGGAGFRVVYDESEA